MGFLDGDRRYLEPDELERQRDTLFRSLIERPEITDENVLAAMAAVPRHMFVPPTLQRRAYEDVALAIGMGQTISQPYMVAIMTQALELSPTDRVLEVGTGSGYQAAVLAPLCAEVTTVEVLPQLSESAERKLRLLGLYNVTCVVGDGSRGYPEGAPYNAILVAAAADEVPQPLIDQLAPNGRLVAPIGPTDVQTLRRWRKREDGGVDEEVLLQCRFVPLVGEFGRKDF